MKQNNIDKINKYYKQKLSKSHDVSMPAYLSKPGFERFKPANMFQRPGSLLLMLIISILWIAGLIYSIVNLMVSNIQQQDIIKDQQYKLKAYIGQQLDSTLIDTYVNYMNKMLANYNLGKYHIKDEFQDILAYPVEHIENCFTVLGGEMGNRILPKKGKDYHQGHDIVMVYDSIVINPLLIDGIVYNVSNNKIGGNYVVINFTFKGDEYRIALLHLSEIDVIPNQKLIPGQKIGVVGSSGEGANGQIHLCYALYKKKKDMWYAVNMFSNSLWRPFENSERLSYDFLLD
jgi:murein DD-endopeptidase MepM/ murein hydrolase activator NlpD